MTRYAADFVIQCASREAAEATLDAVRVLMEAAGLTLHPEKTRIVDASAPGGFAPTAQSESGGAGQIGAGG